jgi:hypothetical protein
LSIGIEIEDWRGLESAEVSEGKPQEPQCIAERTMASYSPAGGWDIDAQAKLQEFFYDSKASREIARDAFLVQQGNIYVTQVSPVSELGSHAIHSWWIKYHRSKPLVSSFFNTAMTSFPCAPAQWAPTPLAAPLLAQTVWMTGGYLVAGLLWEE